MCWHKWTKWEQYTKEFKWMPFKGPQAGKIFDKIEHKQKRHCPKCGKEQVETIENK